MKNPGIFLTLILLISSQLVLGQSYTLKKDASKASVLGTSTLHDWESEVETFTAKASVNGKTLTSVSFEADVKSIKSGKSGMDKNTYKAMNADKFPKITFTSENLQISGTKVTGSGSLTIAGVTKQVPVNLTLEQWNEGSFVIQGSVTLKMTDFGIDPPTAMMGTIKTGDEIEVRIELSLNQ